MKIVMMFLASIGVVLGLNGCGGGGDSGDYVAPVDDMTTLFLVDEYGNSYSGVPYICGSMTVWSTTPANGEFSFYPGEDCTFDFTGLYGTDPLDPTVPYNEYIYIVDDLDNGKNGIPYECEYFGVGTTYNDGVWDGAFDYDADDACVFYL